MTDAGRREARNTLALEVYQIVVRVGWIFKTETIIMPAVLDAVVDSGLLRGLLPVLNRGGQSLPPLLAAGFIGRLPVKKWALARTSLAMAACFLLLAAAWQPLAATRPDLLAGLFLAVYALFSATNGLNQLVLAALQGKLISPGNRGRALVVGVALGSVAAILAGAACLGRWLEEADGFPKIFAATGAFFALAALVPPWLDEPADGPPRRPPPGRWPAAVRGWVAEQAGLLRRDPALVRLSLVAACFAAVLILFPHYQAFARDKLGTAIGSLLTWVLVQNAATGAASLVAGPFSDRRGTRLVLVWLVALSSLTPLVVIALGRLEPGAAAGWFWVVYVPLGLNPISLKIFTHYALELAPEPRDHARYVSLVGVALALPFVLSPLVGMAVDRVGFGPVFAAGFAVIGVGALLALGLPEPRHRRGDRQEGGALPPLTG
ncbi:MAG: MFS transporter [Planctomycetes bacterium]|nr:MFS transporter [Planctomycetota bacterium]